MSLGQAERARPETLKNQLQDILAKALDCKMMAEGLQIDLIPSAEQEDKPTLENPTSTKTGFIVQQIGATLSEAQAALREACGTLQG